MIVDQYKALIKKFVNQFKLNFGNHYNINDIEQEAWLALLKANKYFDSNRGVKFITYAYTYIYRELLKFVRKQAAHRALPIEEAAQVPFYEEKDRADMVEFLKNQLTPYEQTIIDAKFNGKSYKEIASITGVGPITVSKHFDAAIEKLKRAANRELSVYENN